MDGRDVLLCNCSSSSGRKTTLKLRHQNIRAKDIYKNRVKMPWKWDQLPSWQRDNQIFSPVIELPPIPLANQSRASYTSIMNPLTYIPTSSLRLPFPSSASHFIKRFHTDTQASPKQIPWCLTVSSSEPSSAWGYRQSFTPFKTIPRILHALQTMLIILALYC